MTENYRVDQLPESVIREDHQLEGTAASASEALARLRWHWTDDESNPDAVTYRVYARAVGRSDVNVRRYAIAYGNYVQKEQSANLEKSFAEFLAVAAMSEPRRIAVEAVAEARGISLNYARSGQNVHVQLDVREVRNAIADEAERREDAGENFDASEQETYAKRVAEFKHHGRELARRVLEESKDRHTQQYLFADGHLIRAKVELKKALETIDGVEFSDQEVSLLESQNEEVQALARFVQKALTGESGTDWDAELDLLRKAT